MFCLADLKTWCSYSFQKASTVFDLTIKHFFCTSLASLLVPKAHHSSIVVFCLSELLSVDLHIQIELSHLHSVVSVINYYFSEGSFSSLRLGNKLNVLWFPS